MSADSTLHAKQQGEYAVESSQNNGSFWLSILDGERGRINLFFTDAAQRIAFANRLLAAVMPDTLDEALADHSAGASCPHCGINDMEILVWDEDAENVTCQNCEFCWSPNSFIGQQSESAKQEAAANLAEPPAF